MGIAAGLLLVGVEALWDAVGMLWLRESGDGRYDDGLGPAGISGCRPACCRVGAWHAKRFSVLRGVVKKKRQKRAEHSLQSNAHVHVLPDQRLCLTS